MFVLSDLLQIYVKALVERYHENPRNKNPSKQLTAIAAFARQAPPRFMIGKEVFKEIVSLV